MPMEVKDKNFKEKVLESGKPVLVDFWGSWCIPCKRMEPVIEELNKEHEGKIKFVSLNINKSPKTPRQYNVKGVPTYALFWKGELVKRDVGAKSKKQLKEFIEKSLNEINWN